MLLGVSERLLLGLYLRLFLRSPWRMRSKGDDRGGWRADTTDMLATAALSTSPALP